ncbi:Hypothetical protein PHPALM_20705 [Phytophthora palmivora]|uniref:Transmembrane protein 198 n=1 Tax=Phytophthora palmivora TaxID=4796 RepID=A0A2P4XE81_9STRA|nr:Hypothetical protein PHPALM_20705 [Phytophthora palmivora]
MSFVLQNLVAIAFLQLCVAGSSSNSGSFSDVSDDSSLEGVTDLLSSAKDVKVGPAVLAVAAVLGGGIVCLAGYRLFRPTVFCCAFMVGGLFVAGIVETAFSSEDWMPTASWIGFGIGGVITGVFVLMLYSASIFLTGAAGGVMLAFSINTTVGTKIYPSNPDVILVVLAVVLGIVGGLLALKLEKPVLITTTAIVGATVCVWGVGYFAGDYPNGADLKQFRAQNDHGDWVYNIPDAWWGYLAGMIVLFILGMNVQIKKTARGYDHSGKTETHALIQFAFAISDDDTTATVKTIFDSSDGMDINGVVLAVGGGVVIAVIFEKVFKDETWVLTASWIAFVVGGIVVGYVCVYLYWVGIFMGGAVAGAAFGILINTSFGYKFAPSHPATVLIVLVAIFAVVGGAVALWLQKPALIAGTSLVGAFLLFWGIGYFAGNYPTFNDLERFRTYNSSGDLVYSIPGAWWGYLIGTFVVFGLSVVLQFRFTGKDVDYHTLDRRGSEDLLPRHGEMTPARVQYANMNTPGGQTQYPQYQRQHPQYQQPFNQQRYPTSNQVQWEDLQNQQPTRQNTPESYVDTSIVQPQYHQREHEYQISDIVPTTTRPQQPSTPSAPNAPQSHVV